MDAGLFGIIRSNRDFSDERSWGKNEFNSSFPAAMLCYMQSVGIKSIYLKYAEAQGIYQTEIDTNDVFGIKYDSLATYFGFEEKYMPFNEVLIGKTPVIDLVVKNLEKDKYIRGLEVKLTAIPDTTTYKKKDELFGAELVIRQPTISYLAANIALHYKNRKDQLRKIMGIELDSIKEWSNEHEVLLKLPTMVEKLNQICAAIVDIQSPLVVQPIWKTIGKSSILADQCLDCFIWSDLAFIQLILSRINDKIENAQSVDRPIRAIIWLMKMLYDYNRDKRIDAQNIMHSLSFEAKNDKALSISGAVTNQFLKCEYLTRPRISKLAIKNIILGKGIEFLSPERRFDASIFHSPDLR